MESFLQNHHYPFPATPNVNSFEIRKFLNNCTCTYSWAKEKISSQNPEFITWIIPACFSMMVLLQLYRQWKGRCWWINSGLSGTLLTCKYNNPRQRNWRWMNYQCGPIISKCINFLHYFLYFFFKSFEHLNLIVRPSDSRWPNSGFILLKNWVVLHFAPYLNRTKF